MTELFRFHLETSQFFFQNINITQIEWKNYFLQINKKWDNYIYVKNFICERQEIGYIPGVLQPE